MAPRAIGTATISFGLVSIPVKVFSTNKTTSTVSFNMLHEKCGGRVKQQYICPNDDDVVVPRDEMTKGYEFSKGQYVLFTADELKAVEQEANRAMEISEFVNLEQVDPLFFDKPYYLGPDTGGEKPYRLLGDAMKETGRAAIARYATRGKQHIVLIRPFEDGGLIMQQLRYADEVKNFSEIELEDVKVSKAERQLAVQLIEQIANDEFDNSQYQDEVKKRILEVVDQKVAGKEVTIAPTEEPKAQIIDIMDALKASLSGKGGAKKPSAARKAAKKVAKKPKAKKKKAAR